MRTTLTIDDDVLVVVRELARSRSTSLGKMTTELLREALEAECSTAEIGGLTVLDPGEDSPRISSSTVRRLLEDEP